MNPKVEYISVDVLIELHEEIILESGGLDGVLFEATLEHLSLYLEENFEMANEENIFMASAIILHSIVTQHPFFDGNKRTGLAAADAFLIENGYELEINKGESIEFCLAVARGDKSAQEIKYWLEKRTKKTL